MTTNPGRHMLARASTLIIGGVLVTSAAAQDHESAPQDLRRPTDLSFRFDPADGDVHLLRGFSLGAVQDDAGADGAETATSGAATAPDTIWTRPSSPATGGGCVPISPNTASTSSSG